MRYDALYEQAADAAAAAAAAAVEPSAAAALSDVADTIRDRRFPVGPPRAAWALPGAERMLADLFTVRVANAVHRGDAAAACGLAAVARSCGLSPTL